MRRNCSLEEISDGNLYHSNDLVVASCNGCKGYAVCCHGMGKSIILDPYDICRLSVNLDTSFEKLLAEQKIELNVVDGIILPNLKMTGESEQCSFLKPDGRCSIHASRPGICRIFPLGRYYENHEFHYFLQKHECRKTSKTKIKISKWIDTPDLKKNEQFLIDWHYFLNDVEAAIKHIQEDSLVKKAVMYLLNRFYVKNYDPGQEFYSQFYDRLNEAKGILF